MKKINISGEKNKHFFAIVDDEDFYLNKYNWFYTGGYVRRMKRIKGERKVFFLHKIIMGCGEDKTVDHKDRNVFNNLKSNLRICTRSQNNMNRKSLDNCKSKYKGVSYSLDGKRKKRWSACITKNYKIIRLNRFKTELEAARQYNCAAKILFGEYAYLNDIPSCKNWLNKNDK